MLPASDDAVYQAVQTNFRLNARPITHEIEARMFNLYCDEQLPAPPNTGTRLDAIRALIARQRESIEHQARFNPLTLPVELERQGIGHTIGRVLWEDFDFYKNFLNDHPVRSIPVDDDHNMNDLLAASAYHLEWKASVLKVDGGSLVGGEMLIFCDEYGRIPEICHSFRISVDRLDIWAASAQTRNMACGVLLGLSTIQSVFCTAYAEDRKRVRGIQAAETRVPWQVAARAQRMFLRVVMDYRLLMSPYFMQMVATACASIVYEEWFDDLWRRIGDDEFVNDAGVSVHEVREMGGDQFGPELYEEFMYDNVKSYATWQRQQLPQGSEQLPLTRGDMVFYFVEAGCRFWNDELPAMSDGIKRAFLSVRSLVLQLFRYDSGAMSDHLARFMEFHTESIGYVKILYSALYWCHRDVELFSHVEALRQWCKDESLWQVMLKQTRSLCFSIHELLTCETPAPGTVAQVAAVVTDNDASDRSVERLDEASQRTSSAEPPLILSLCRVPGMHTRHLRYRVRRRHPVHNQHKKKKKKNRSRGKCAPPSSASPSDAVTAAPRHTKWYLFRGDKVLGPTLTRLPSRDSIERSS